MHKTLIALMFITLPLSAQQAPSLFDQLILTTKAPEKAAQEEAVKKSSKDISSINQFTKGLSLMAAGDGLAASEKFWIAGRDDLSNYTLLEELAHSFLLSAGDTDSALKLLDALVAEGHKSIKLFRLRALAKLGAKDVRTAEEMFKKLTDTKKITADDYYHLALSKAYQGELVSANIMLNELLQLQGDHFPSLILQFRASAFMQKGNAVIPVARKVKALLTGDEWEALLALPEFDVLRGELQERLKEIPGATKSPRNDFVLVDPAQGFEFLGYPAGTNKNPVRFINTFAQSISLKRFNVTEELKKPKTAMENGKLVAAMLIRQKKYVEAMVILEQMHKRTPNDRNLNYVLSQLYESNGLLERAVDMTRRALPYPKKEANIYYTQGRCLQKLNRLPEAARSYSRALAVAPDRDTINNNLGIVLSQMGFYNNAAEHFKKAIELNNVYADALNNYGTLLMDVGEYAKAEVQYEALQGYFPRYPKLYRNLGTCLLKQGRLAEAITYLEEGITERPDSSVLHQLLGDAYIQWGKWDKAQQVLDTAVRLDPANPAAIRLFGIALRKEWPSTAARRVLFREVIIYYEKNTVAAGKIISDRISELIDSLGTTTAEQSLAPASKIYQWVSKQASEKKYKSAKELLARFLKQKPNDGFGHYLYGKLLSETNDPIDAQLHFKEATFLIAEDPRPYNDMAMMLIKNEPTEGELAQAIIAANKACELTGFNEATFLDTLALTQFTNGQAEQARQTAGKALSLAMDKGQIRLAGEIRKHMAQFMTSESEE